MAYAWGDNSLLATTYASLTERVEVEPDARVLDIIGAWLDAYARLPGLPWLREKEDAFAADLDEVLRETPYARRGRDLVLRVDAGSASVIEEPFRAFVTGRSDLVAVERRLHDALTELDAGRGGDAITDAGTALQEMLTVLGHRGPTLGDQIKAARGGGQFTAVDSQLGNALESLAKWVASVRNQRSDSHPGPEPDLRDAQLLVRIVIVLVMRLASGRDDTHDESGSGRVAAP